MAIRIRSTSVTGFARWFAGIIFGLVILGGYGLLIWQAPRIVVGSRLNMITDSAQRATAEYNARVQVVSIAGAVVVSIGLTFTARTYALNRRGQVTERFSKALERLGSEELYVRIGGIHALEHVMNDSARHHNDVVEVLVAFIRERTPRVISQQEVNGTLGRWIHPPEPHELSPPTLPAEPEPDVQAALIALSRRPAGLGRRETRPIDLSRLHLRRAILAGANLSGAILSGADLRGAHLNGADLRRAYLGDADLHRAWLIEANLSGTFLRDAELSRAYLMRANLCRADLSAADLIEANLSGADLRGANLMHAYLFGANLGGANLRGAALIGVDLKDTNISSARNLPAEYLPVADEQSKKSSIGKAHAPRVWRKRPLSDGEPTPQLRKKR